MSLRKRVMAGEVVLGSMVFEFFSPGMAQIMKRAGCEYVIYDMEHTGLGYETVKAQVAACRGIGVAPMARVPRSDSAFLARALDIGCEGVMIPMVNTADEARAIVDACRYPPVGRRGAAFGFAHDHYEGGSPVDKIKAANKRNLVIAQIETEHGLANVEDTIAIGPGPAGLYNRAQGAIRTDQQRIGHTGPQNRLVTAIFHDDRVADHITSLVCCTE